MNTYPITKLIIFCVLILHGFNLYGQSFVIGEPQGVLKKIILNYKSIQNINENAIIDVEIKQIGDTSIFCVGYFKNATDVFLCIPNSIFQLGLNYIFVKNGAGCYFSFNEQYLKFVYNITVKYTIQNLIVKSYSPLNIEYTDDVITVGGDIGVYRWNWYYVVDFKIIKWSQNDFSLYSTCDYGGVP